MKFTEKVCIVLALIAVVTGLLHVLGGSVFLVIAVVVLSLLYLMFGFALYNGIQLRKAFSKQSYAGISAVDETLDYCEAHR